MWTWRPVRSCRWWRAGRLPRRQWLCRRWSSSMCGSWRRPSLLLRSFLRPRKCLPVRLWRLPRCRTACSTIRLWGLPRPNRCRVFAWQVPYSETVLNECDRTGCEVENIWTFFGRCLGLSGAKIIQIERNVKFLSIAVRRSGTMRGFGLCVEACASFITAKNLGWHECRIAWRAVFFCTEVRQSRLFVIKIGWQCIYCGNFPIFASWNRMFSAGRVRIGWAQCRDGITTEMLKPCLKIR